MPNLAETSIKLFVLALCCLAILADVNDKIHRNITVEALDSSNLSNINKSATSAPSN